MIKLYTIEQNNIIYYVGITKLNLNDRLCYHRSPANSNNKKKNWFNQQSTKINKPIIKLLDTFETVQEAIIAEKFYILLLRYYGMPLLNNSDGGEYSNPKGKIVHQYSIQGDFIKTFDSPKAAARFFNKNCSKEIRNCCKGTLSKANGFVWRFDGDCFNKYKVLKVNEIQSIVIAEKLSIKINRYDIFWNLIETHDSISDIVRKGLGNAVQIRKILKEERQYSKGFRFKLA